MSGARVTEGISDPSLERDSSGFTPQPLLWRGVATPSLLSLVSGAGSNLHLTHTVGKQRLKLLWTHALWSERPRASYVFSN